MQTPARGKLVSVCFSSGFSYLPYGFSFSTATDTFAHNARYSVLQAPSLTLASVYFNVCDLYYNRGRIYLFQTGADSFTSREI